MRASRGKDWTLEEVKKALELYLSSGRVPDKSDAKVKALASALGRTPDAVVYKIGNLRYIETKGKKGFAHGGAKDREAWTRFAKT